MAGRRPKSTKEKELAGNPGKRKLNKNEPKPESAIPSCPKHLSGEAKYEWRRLAPLLHELGILSQIDRTAFAAYCDAYGQWVQAKKAMAAPDFKAVEKTANGYPVVSPWLGISSRALKQVKEYLIEFGMTPASRSRVSADKKDDIDPMEEFLNRGKKKS